MKKLIPLGQQLLAMFLSYTLLFMQCASFAYAKNPPRASVSSRDDVGSCPIAISYHSTGDYDMDQRMQQQESRYTTVGQNFANSPEGKFLAEIQDVMDALKDAGGDGVETNSAALEEALAEAYDEGTRSAYRDAYEELEQEQNQEYLQELCQKAIEYIEREKVGVGNVALFISTMYDVYGEAIIDSNKRSKTLEVLRKKIKETINKNQGTGYVFEEVQALAALTQNKSDVELIADVFRKYANEPGVAPIAISVVGGILMGMQDLDPQYEHLRKAIAPFSRQKIDISNFDLLSLATWVEGLYDLNVKVKSPLCTMSILTGLESSLYPPEGNYNNNNSAWMHLAEEMASAAEGDANLKRVLDDLIAGTVGVHGTQGLYFNGNILFLVGALSSGYQIRIQSHGNVPTFSSGGRVYTDPDNQAKVDELLQILKSSGLTQTEYVALFLYTSGYTDVDPATARYIRNYLAGAFKDKTKAAKWGVVTYSHTTGDEPEQNYNAYRTALSVATVADTIIMAIGVISLVVGGIAACGRMYSWIRSSKNGIKALRKINKAARAFHSTPLGRNLSKGITKLKKIKINRGSVTRAWAKKINKRDILGRAQRYIRNNRTTALDEVVVPPAEPPIFLENSLTGKKLRVPGEFKNKTLAELEKEAQSLRAKAQAARAEDNVNTAEMLLQEAQEIEEFVADAKKFGIEHKQRLGGFSSEGGTIRKVDPKSPTAGGSSQPGRATATDLRGRSSTDQAKVNNFLSKATQGEKEAWEALCEIRQSPRVPSEGATKAFLEKVEASLLDGTFKGNPNNLRNLKNLASKVKKLEGYLSEDGFWKIYVGDAELTANAIQQENITSILAKIDNGAWYLGCEVPIEIENIAFSSKSFFSALRESGRQILRVKPEGVSAQKYKEALADIIKAVKQKYPGGRLKIRLGAHERGAGGSQFMDLDKLHIHLEVMTPEGVLVNNTLYLDIKNVKITNGKRTLGALFDEMESDMAILKRTVNEKSGILKSKKGGTPQDMEDLRNAGDELKALQREIDQARGDINYMFDGKAGQIDKLNKAWNDLDKFIRQNNL